MGRPKTYDRDDIAERAMQMFWERGYHATSTRELSEAMGVNPYSLYAEFGSKEGLYEAAIARYEARIVTRHFAKLETPEASLAEVRSVLTYFGENGTRRGGHLGCLICNASTELAPHLEGSRASTARFVARVTAAFANALGNAQRAGLLVPEARVDALAASFCTLLMGLFVLSRAQVDANVIRAAAGEGLLRLDSLTDRRAG